MASQARPSKDDDLLIRHIRPHDITLRVRTSPLVARPTSRRMPNRLVLGSTESVLLPQFGHDCLEARLTLRRQTATNNAPPVHRERSDSSLRRSEPPGTELLAWEIDAGHRHENVDRNVNPAGRR